MATNPNYETRTLLAPFLAGFSVPTFLRDTFFGAREFPPTSVIEFDFRRGRRKMAPFVAPLVGGKLMERQGFETRFFRAPRIAPVRALRTPDLEARLPGESIYDGRTAASRAAELIAEDAVFCDEAIARREEWMCRNVLVNGAISVTADTGYTQLIDFTASSASPTGNPTLNHDVPAIKWDTAGSDPLADLEAARLNTIKASGIAPNVALFGVNAAKVFMRNDSVKTLLDNRRIEIGSVSPIIQSPSVVRFGAVPGLELYEYAEYFEDDAGNIFPMLPDNFVMLLSTTTPNRIVYGAFTQLEDARAHRFVTYQTSRIPFVYGDEEDGTFFYRLTSCPLPMPADILGFRIIEALAMTYPAMAPEGQQQQQPRMLDGTAVLDPMSGKVEGGPEEAEEMRQQAIEDAEKARAEAASKTRGNGPSEEEHNGDLNQHTVEELREIAANEHIELSGADRKADIIKAIKRARKE